MLEPLYYVLSDHQPAFSNPLRKLVCRGLEQLAMIEDQETA